jgi:hypothetical protein
VDRVEVTLERDRERQVAKVVPIRRAANGDEPDSRLPVPVLAELV